MFSPTQQPRAYFLKWVDRRNPAASSHRLNRRNLFVFPTRRGFVFLLIMLALWVLGTNYQNNLILGLVFLMIGLFVMAILKTFNHLNHLQLSLHRINDCYAGDYCSVELQCTAGPGGWIENLRLRWDNDDQHHPVQDLESGLVVVPWQTQQRGIHPLPRLKVDSDFPLGLIRCWTWLNWSEQVYVYPQPLAQPLTDPGRSSQPGDKSRITPGGEDIGPLTPYIPGDSLNAIAWKAYARGQGLLTKRFEQSFSDNIWLDYQQLAGDRESRLSVLCYWVIQLSKSNQPFGLVLPGQRFDIAGGDIHRRRCLRALAAVGYPQ